MIALRHGAGRDSEFLVGVNLPWLDYGIDFGANAWQPEGGLCRPERQDRLRPVLRQLADQGASLVRWFLIGDGRAGLREDRDGLALDDSFYRDLDAGLELLAEAGLPALFVLIDFLWFARPRTVGGVRLHGRRDSVKDPARRARLLDGVFRPLFARYGRHPGIAAWDVVNEPEWATFGVGAWDPGASVSRLRMRRFIEEVVRAAHEATIQPVTVGCASTRWLDLVTGLGLDFYQAHWYESLDTEAALRAPVSAMALDRPLLLGEYPTRGARLPPASIVSAVRASGWCGALAWSVLAEDAATDRIACAAVPGRRLPA